MTKEIIISGRISSESAETLEQTLRYYEGENISHWVFRIDSPGGSTTAGLAMHDAIAALPGKKEAVILGVCASAATFLACACDTIVMRPNSTIMIHAPQGGLYGSVAQIKADLKFFEDLEHKVHAMYAARTGQSEEEIAAFLADSSNHYFNAQEALAAHWCDSILPPVPGGSSQEPTPAPDSVAELAPHKSPVWDIPEMVASALDIFRSPDAVEERKATRKLADMEAHMADLESRVSAAEQSAEAAREELARVAAEREEYAQRAVSSSIASLGLDANELPPAEDKPVHTSADIAKITKEQGLSAGLAAANSNRRH